VRDAHGQEVKVNKVRNGVITLTVGAAMLGGEALGTSAQDDDGAGDVETAVAAGTLDDGQALLPLAGLSLEAAVEAAQGAASGAVGEVDLEYVGDRLVFNVDIGDLDVKVDASSGAVLSVDLDDLDD
jgi:uncharacterized membrane protein YkoI